MCARTEVALIGGGNSAGQAAVLSRANGVEGSHAWFAGPDLAASMSRYLIDRIDATPEHRRPSAHAVSRRRRRIPPVDSRRHWRGRKHRLEEQREIRHVFRLCRRGSRRPAGSAIAAVMLDRQGFVLTGQPRRVGCARSRALESTVPGVFAVGDVRSGSVKRVGGAIGEGARGGASSTSISQPPRESSRRVRKFSSWRT
jgi:thioredoxin reductase (NADPH)